MFKKHDHDKILTRLTTILSRLYYGELLSVSELAEEFNVSVRTIRRDFTERLIAFPIEKYGAKWRMMPGHRLERCIEAEESITLDILEQLALSQGAGFGSKAARLLHKLRDGSPGPFYIKAPLGNIGQRLAEVVRMENAIASHTKARFHYQSDEGEKHVLMEPYRIVNYEDYWYLLGRDPQADLIKKYRIEKIIDFEEAEEPFIPDPEIDAILERSVNIWFMPDKEPYTVRLYVAPGAAKFLSTRPISSTQKIESSHEDGSITLSLEVTSEMEILPTIRYWFPEIHVLEPESLKERMEADVRSYLQSWERLG